MELFAQIVLPQSLKKANEAAIQFKIGEFGEYEQKLSSTGMLDDMEYIHAEKLSETEEGRARIM